MLKKYGILLPLLLSGCVAPVAVGGLGKLGFSAVEDRGINGVASDQALALRINSQVFDNYNFIGLNITVYKGRVLLTGIVPNESVKQQAVGVVRNVSGVKEIINELKVQFDDAFLDNARDTWLTARLKANLFADQDVYAPNYIVHTFDRVIYIFGTAATAEELQRVLNNAREIEGVRKVVNLIEHKTKAKQRN